MNIIIHDIFDYINCKSPYLVKWFLIIINLIANKLLFNFVL